MHVDNNMFICFDMNTCVHEKYRWDDNNKNFKMYNLSLRFLKYTLLFVSPLLNGVHALLILFFAIWDMAVLFFQVNTTYYFINLREPLHVQTFLWHQSPFWSFQCNYAEFRRKFSKINYWRKKGRLFSFTTVVNS